MTLTLTPLVAMALAFSLCLGLTPLVVRLARRAGLIDPARDTQGARAVPRLGGLAIAAAFYAPILGLRLRTNLFSQELYGEPNRISILLGGGLIILLLGVYDDVRGARAWQKLLIQIPLAALAWWGGVRIGETTFVGGPMTLSTGLSFVVTVGWIVLVVNAINLIDGLDGLASGVALQALVVVALCAWLRGNALLVVCMLTLAAAVGGFLVHNFHPATVFMGDSGSMFLGWVLAVSTVMSAQKAATLVGVVLPMLTLALPLLDTVLAVWRRVLRRQPIMHGDLDHIHHRLMRRGWSHRRSVLTMYAVAFCFSSLSAALVIVADARWHWTLMSLALLLAVAVAGWLGYHQSDARRARS